METNQKNLKRAYQQSHRQMGVFQIRNLSNEKVFVGMSPNLPGIINRHKFQLQMGNHQNRQLQQDWSEAGGDKFAFEILDELTPNEDASRDYQEELLLLEDLWLEKLQPYGEQGYNERKKSRVERLRFIMQNRNREER